MFVVFEGIDGCGKGTQADRAVAYLKDTFGACTYLKYPDRSTPLGKIIDSWFKEYVGLMDKGCDGPGPGIKPSKHDFLALQGLLLANKIEVQSRLQSALKYGHVIADRYSPSAISYGTADGLSEKWLIDSHSALLQPDMYILLDIPVEESFRRRPNRQEAYENNVGRLERARAMYLHQAKADPKRWYVVDGTQNIDGISVRIHDALNRLYGEML